MLETQSKPATIVRGLCFGEFPLLGRLEPWMVDVANAAKLAPLVEQFGSPLNLLDHQPFERNIGQLRAVAQAHDLDFEVYFARKANKCLTFVEAANRQDAGIDIASLQELEQVLKTGTRPEKIICTAAIKTRPLIELCGRHGVTIAVDNLDELNSIRTTTLDPSTNRQCTRTQPSNIALRVSGFQHDGQKLHSRFGFDIDEVLNIVTEHWPDASTAMAPILRGIHFHLDGYCPSQRVSAIDQSLRLIDQLNKLGHSIEFLDIGGGLPISYLDSEAQWETFWEELRQAVLGQRPPVTYRNHGLGLITVEGKIHGKRQSYPFYQTLTRDDWLDQILTSPCRTGVNPTQAVTIADAIRQRNLQLRCEPGRSVLDGAGMTVARVEFRKRNADGDWLIGLAMNRTQCRTSSADFLVDPLLVRGTVPDTEAASDAADAMSGFLVGAYCTESELLSLRRIEFPAGVNVGDLICFPNTAGYFMHFLESRSHQFPLAKNLTRQHDQWQLDPLDRETNA